jgi:hypothetical protein
MPTEDSQAYCARCERMVLTQRALPQHLIHALATCATCGIWAPVWLGVSMRTKPWRCTTCGGTELGRPSLQQPTTAPAESGLAYKAGRWLRGRG